LVSRRDRMMLVADDPLTVDLAQPDGQAEVQIVTRSIGFVDDASHLCGGKGNVITRRDGYLMDVEHRRIRRSAEEQVPGFFVSRDALRLEWRRNVEHQYVGRVVAKNACDIFPAHSAGPVLDDAADRGFVRRG